MLPVGVRLRYSIGVGRNILVHLLVEPLRHLWQANGCQCQRCYTDDCCAFHNLRPFFTFSVNKFRSLLFSRGFVVFSAFVCGFVMALPVVSFSLSALPMFRFVYGSFQRKTALVLIPVLRALFFPLLCGSFSGWASFVICFSPLFFPLLLR